VSEQELDFEAITTHIQKLKSQNRWLWLALSSSLALIALLFFLTLEPHRSIEAESFVLKDSRGNRRAVLTAGPPFLMANDEATRALVREQFAKTLRTTQGSEEEKEQALKELSSLIDKGFRESRDPQLVFYGDEGRPKLNIGLFNSAPHVILGGEQSTDSVGEASIRMEVERLLNEPVIALDGHVARIALRVNSIQPALTFTSKKGAVRSMANTGKSNYVYEPGIDWMSEKEEGEMDDWVSKMEWPK
jgi:hypothetical protein